MAPWWRLQFQDVALVAQGIERRFPVPKVARSIRVGGTKNAPLLRGAFLYAGRITQRFPSIQNTYLATEFPAFGFPTSNDAVEKAPRSLVSRRLHTGHAQATSSIEKRIPLSYWSVRPGRDEVEAYPLPQLFRAVFFLAGFPPHGRAWSRVGIAYAGEESRQHIDVLVINIVKDDPTNAFNMIGSSSL